MVYSNEIANSRRNTDIVPTSEIKKRQAPTPWQAKYQKEEKEEDPKKFEDTEDHYYKYLAFETSFYESLDELNINSDRYMHNQLPRKYSIENLNQINLDRRELKIVIM